MIWWMDLLTTCTHHPELQAITVLALISTLYRSPHTKSRSDIVFTSRCLVTATKSGDPSVSVLTSLPVWLTLHNWTVNLIIAPSILSHPCRTQLSTNWVSQSQSQSQGHFTSGGLPPISSSWRQAPWDPRPEFLFSNWTLAVIILM
jgi:hypothetical protein